MDDHLNRPRGLFQTIPHTFRPAPHPLAAHRAAIQAHAHNRHLHMFDNLPPHPNERNA